MRSIELWGNDRRVAALMLVAALAYLAPFVPRGWVPHDEGMIGQSAERVLLGGTPHVDYEESYTGGLTWLYAAVFKIAGVDLLYLRWLLFAGASLALVVMYLILRRYLSPIGAAFGTWVGLAWSFPNFFAGLPSWWVLICALCCLWGFVRYVETDRLRYAAIAGLAAGMAIVVKQTGVYLLVALIMSLLYERGQGIWRAGRIAAAIAAGLLAVAILSPRLAPAETIYLLLPILACSVVLLSLGGERSRSVAPAVAVAAAVVPIALLVAPYVIHDQLADLVEGLFVLPQKRLVFASRGMPPAALILAGIPLVPLVLPVPHRWRFAVPDGLAWRATWGVVLIVWMASLYQPVLYKAVWESARAFAALLPFAVCWLLISGHVRDPQQRRLLFGFGSMLAWAALVQFPFSAPIYFCYVAPLAVVAATAAAANSSTLGHRTFVAWAALLIVFGASAMNRGYIYHLGQFHAPETLNTRLGIPRAHLRVSESDALIYRRVVFLVKNHVGHGRLVAGPDCPEVYFLAGLVNPSGALFDFFSDDDTDWTGARVIVLNRGPHFSAEPSARLLADAREVFPEGEAVGPFEVRWR